MPTQRQRNNQVALRQQELKRKQAEQLTEQKLHNMDWICADTSGSMASPAFEGKKRIECLREAVTPFAGRVQVIAFPGGTWSYSFCSADEIPNAVGGTPMTEAFNKLLELEPLHILVVSDGQPDRKSTALEAAGKLAEQCVIDVLYIGPEDPDAITFMQELARMGHGRYSKFDLNNQSPLLLGNKVAEMLALPAPGTIEL